MPDLRGKVAIISGASSGIGAATALEFARLGCAVCITGRNEANLAHTAKLFKETVTASGTANDAVITVVGDVTNEAHLQDAVTKTLAAFGKLDILVNNAGILSTGGALTTDVAAFDDTMNVNVRSVIRLTQLCAPHIIKTKGSIVNVSSIAGPCADVRSNRLHNVHCHLEFVEVVKRGKKSHFGFGVGMTKSCSEFPGVAYYCMSKAAIDQFTKCLALELAPSQVRVNAVNPGVIITDVHKRAGMSEAQYTAFLEHSKTTHALGRPGTADEVAKAIVFLASDDASFTTGMLLTVDGGRGIITPR